MTSNVRKLATSLLLANVCAESANQAIAKDRTSGGMGACVFGSMTFGPTPFSNTSESGQVQTGYSYGETSVSAQQAAAAIDVGVNAYAQAIAAIGKAAAAQQVDTDYINAMRADGWAYAGLYYVKIVKD
jgi:hypothetical protein